MQANLSTLLDKSFLFSSLTGAHVDINTEGDFQFFLPSCFYDCARDEEMKLQNFASELKMFVFHYLEAWVDIIDTNPEKPFDWKKFGFSMGQYFSSLDTETIFKKVQSGDEVVSVPINPNESQLLVRRMGDILVFNVCHISGNKEKKHLTGVRAVESLCRSEESRNNQGVYEMLHNIEVSLPIEFKRTKSGGSESDVDFKSIFGKIKEFLPQINWDFNEKGLIDSYKNIDDGIVVANYFDFPICARLVHTMKEKEASGFLASQSQRIWRKGNVTRFNESVYRFQEGGDLQLKLSIQSSLPNRLCSYHERVDNSFEARREYFLLASVGAILVSGLCSMMLHSYQYKSIHVLGN